MLQNNYLRMLPLSSVTRFVIRYSWITIVFAFVSCVQVTENNTEPTSSITSDLITRNLTPVTSEPHHSQTRLPVQLTQEPEIQPSQAPQITSENNTYTPPTEIEIAGQIYIFEPNGLHRLKLPTRETVNLFETKNDLSNWGAQFAQNKKLIAYWIKQNGETDLWFTSLADWQPELLITVNDLEYDFATPLWDVNDRYLFFLLSILDNSGPFEDVKTLRTYIFDTKTNELVGATYWPGECSILAPSTRSGQMALWCHQVDEQAQEYLVLEPEQDPWFTNETPNILTDKCNIYATCNWSQDGEFVVYVDQDNFPEEMFYSSVKYPNSIQISDGVSDIYSFPLWSPNSQFLYYAGDCVSGGLQNPTVITVVEQKIIWCTEGGSSRGEFPFLRAKTVSWSPDSSLLAMSFEANSPNMEQAILLFDVAKQEERTRITNFDYLIMDMVWVGD